jgi:hypothetical protein
MSFFSKTELNKISAEKVAKMTRGPRNQYISTLGAPLSVRTLIRTMYQPSIVRLFEVFQNSIQPILAEFNFHRHRMTTENKPGICNSKYSMFVL